MRRRRIYIFPLVCLLFLVACGKPAQPIASIYSVEEYDARIGVWYNFSTVDWAMLDTLYYRPYNCDWPDEYVAFVGENHIPEEDARVWHLLQNARTKFHQDNLPLCAISTPEQCARLDKVDAAFDTVFVHYMQDDYYLRAFVDAYQDVMPEQIDKIKIGH